MKSLYLLKNNLTENSIFLCFRGPFTQELMVEIGALLKSKMKSVDASPSTILKVFSVFVEQSQNIIRHSADPFLKEEAVEDKHISGVVAVGFTNNSYFVTAGNRIENNRVKQLRNRLTQLQNMDREALNKLYREQRKNGWSPEDKQAGLGLIELARKASQPVEFLFEPIDEANSFFSIKAVIET